MATKPLTTSDFYTRMAFNPNLFDRESVSKSRGPSRTLKIVVVVLLVVVLGHLI